ncbi:unnamed protein product [Lactuca saligna]|uniref:Uncharacterized protein n=1 Tax=Lactuca saligna TaxID=75948 RepID=A0AA36EK09_LACSI|nr:unnamed protein product [Lactuca saligna]
MKELSKKSTSVGSEQPLELISKLRRMIWWILLQRTKGHIHDDEDKDDFKKIKEFSELFPKEVQRLDRFSDVVTQKIKAVGKVFDRIEKSLIEFQEALSKFDLTSQYSLSQESLYAMETKGVSSSKASNEDKGKFVGKVMSTQNPTSIPMKPVVTTSTTTTTTPNVNFDLSKLKKKGISIGEGSSSYVVVKNTSNVDPKDKGKGFQFEPSAE